MFRRSPSTAPTLRPDAGDAAVAVLDEGRGGAAGARGRHTRRARQQKADDEAALQARLERVHRRLAEVGSVQVTGRTGAIDTDAARRDPLTRPFAAPGGVPAARRRTDTAAMPRPA